MELFKKFTFEAAHRLPNVSDGHKCGRLHGHSFTVFVHVEGPLNSRLGWVLDFSDIKKAFKPILNQLDHYYLNDIEGLENPTSENLAIWIWQKLILHLPCLSKIVVQETCMTGCVYQGNICD